MEVQATASTKGLVTAQSLSFTSISRPATGVYCLTPAAGINPAADTAAVSPEVSYRADKLPGLIAVNAQRTGCPTTDFEVDTYAPGTPPALANEYAFTIVVP